MDLSIRAILDGFEEARRQLAGLSEGMDRLKPSAESASKATEASAAAIEDLSIAALAAGAAIGGGLGYVMQQLGEKVLDSVKHVTHLGEELHNMSQKTGMSVETLGAFRLVAETSGLSLEALGQGISQFNRHIIDATKETGMSADAFDRLKINIRDNQGALKDSTTLFGEVAEKFKIMEDGAGKTSLAIELFGRAGMNMIPMLNEGAAGMTKLQDEARKAGIVMDAETAEAANKLNSNMAVLKAYGEGFWTSVASPIVEGLAKVTTAMREARRDGEGFFGSMYEGAKRLFEVMFFTGTKQQIGNTKDQIGQSSAYVRELEGQLSTGKDARGNDLTSFQRKSLENRLQAATLSLSELYKQQSDLEARLEVEDPTAGPKTAAPEKSPREKAGRVGSLMAELNKQARMWKDEVTTEDSSPEEYIARLKGLASAYKDNAEVRTHFAAMAATEETRLERQKADEIFQINKQMTDDAMRLLKFQDKQEADGDKIAIENEVKKQEFILKTRQDAINFTAGLTEKQKLSQLEALQTEMRGEQYLSDFSKEWKGKMMRLDEDVAKQRVIVAGETSKQITAIFGKEEVNSEAIFKSMAGAVQSVFTDIFTGHFNLTTDMAKLWKGLSGAAVSEMSRLASRAVMEPLFEPMKGVLSDVGGWIKDAFGSAWTWIKSLFGSSDLSDSVKGSMSGIGDFIKDVFGNAWGWIKGLFGGGSGVAASVGEQSGGAGILSGLSAASSISTLSGGGGAGGLLGMLGLGGSGSSGGGITAEFLAAHNADVAAALAAGEGGTTLAGTAGVTSGVGALAAAGPFAFALGFVLNDMFDKGDASGIGTPSGFNLTNDGRKILTSEMDKWLAAMQKGDGVVPFATGTDMIVSKPTRFVAGEAGSERVTVSPLGGAAHGHMRGEGGRFVNNGIMVADEYTLRKFKRMLTQ